MDYMAYYVVFSVLFFGGMIGYWIVSRAFRDPSLVYVVTERSRT